MRRLLIIAALFALCAIPAHAAETGQVVAVCGTPTGLTYTVPGIGNVTVDQSGRICIFSQSASSPGVPGPTATILTATVTGTTGSVVGTLAGATGKTTYICGFNVQAIGGTAPIGPITVGGLVGGISQIYQGSSSAAGGTVASANFSPCIPANGTNTAITVTTTANATATAVDVNLWGFQQ